MRMRCDICGREHNRSICPFCQRLKRWESTERNLFIARTFSPRLQRDLRSSYFTTEKLHSLLARMNGGGLYIHGPSGCGKTVLAAELTTSWAGRMWIENKDGYGSIRFLSVPNLLQDIKQTFKPDSTTSEHSLIQDLSTASWVVLDDLGVEKTTDWVLQTLYIIINNRYESMKSTIFTSNLSLDDLARRLGDDRIPSRIVGMCQVMEMDGEDKRIRKGE